MQNDIVRPSRPAGTPQLPNNKNTKTEEDSGDAMPRVSVSDSPIAVHDPVPEAAEKAEMDSPATQQEAEPGVKESTSQTDAATDNSHRQIDSGEKAKPPKKHRKSAEEWFRGLSKRQKILGTVTVLVLMFGVGAGWTHLHPKRTVIADTPVKKAAVPKPVPPPPPILSTLTGLPVADASVNQRPVTGVMIENSLDARPQSGLDQAGVVYEAIAEGGITRFLALYQDSTPAYVGPVRSVRPYYLQWCMGFDCAIAHVGGSPEAMKDIPAWGVKNLDQFYNSGAYQRISSRYAPHNVYTSMAQLNQLEASKKMGAADYKGFPRKKDAPSATPTAKSVNLSISGAAYAGGGAYDVHYDYDTASNSYKRNEGGKPHMEVSKSGAQTQITPKVVVALVMKYGLEADDHHSSYNVIGSGQAFVFQDGTVTTGTWSKSDASSQLTLTDASGQPIKLNAGQTWITAMSAAKNVTYTP